LAQVLHHQLEVEVEEQVRLVVEVVEQQENLLVIYKQNKS
jgi:hypothetical protein